MSYPAFQAPWIEEEGVKKHKCDFFVSSMYNKTIIDSVFVISIIIKVSVRVISLSLEGELFEAASSQVGRP